MTDQKKYHGAIEIKDIVSYFLRRMDDIRSYVGYTEEEELILKFNSVGESCKELFALAAKIADAERPPERIVENPDRGIDDFFSGRDCGCDDDCSGGCSGCGGSCNP
ncbi:MAG: hypothetical protein WC516_09155 [Patescibacteria group bacterium]|jgi:hypothetical protein